jgi:hemin uptake protein HemP
MNSESQDHTTEDVAPEAQAIELPAKTLFGDRREVVIVHDGNRYRLRITRKNKLILQK